MLLFCGVLYDLFYIFLRLLCCRAFYTFTHFVHFVHVFGYVCTVKKACVCVCVAVVIPFVFVLFCCVVLFVCVCVGIYEKRHACCTEVCVCVAVCVCVQYMVSCTLKMCVSIV